MKTLIVPDLHGKLDIVYRVLDSSYNIIFMGDYLDSFSISIVDQVETLKLVLEAAEAMPNVKALLGNHELSYLDVSMRASGFSDVTLEHISFLKERMEEVLNPYIWQNDFLISHAGVSSDLLSVEDRTLDEYLKNKDFNQIGASRGGLDYFGGLYWCDWFNEFTTVPTVKQIVGHTGYRLGKEKGILAKEDEYGNRSYNVDCLDHTEEFLLINEDGSIEITTEI